MADLRDEILSYMGKCRVCTIATADTDGKPNASAVFFKNNEFDIYFNTDRESEKAKNILTNPRIALVLQEDGPIAQTDKEIKGIQYVGTATTVMTQSSSITVLTLIGMVNAGIMTFRQ